MTRRRGSVVGWACASFLAFGFSPTAAQQGDFAALRVRVVDASTRAPIAGAQVGFPDLKLFVLTNAKGLAEITQVPPGDRSLEVTMLGYGIASTTISLDAHAVATGDIALKGEPIRIDGITVTTPNNKKKNYPTLIMQDEMAAPGISSRTVYDAIQRLRPQWLRTGTRPANTFIGGVFPGGGMTRANGAAPDNAAQRADANAVAQMLVAVFVDDVQRTFDALKNMQASEVGSVELLSAADATTRWGTGYPNGAVLITTMAK